MPGASILKRAAATAALFALTLSAGATPPVQTPYGESRVAFEVQQVPGAPVYYVIGLSGVPGADNEGFTANAGFVITPEGVVVYDTLGTPVLGWRLLEAIRARTDQPVTHVVVGHYHADHVYGLQAFEQHTGAEIWAQARAREYIDDPGAATRLAQRREALFPWVDDETYVAEPDKTFKDRQVLALGEVRIELVHVGPAHAPDDTIMIVQPYGVLFSGDLIYGGRLPFLGGNTVDTRRWLDGLAYLQSLDPPPRFIIPGHGDADADAARAIAFTRTYIEYLRERMGAAVEALDSFESAYTNTDWSKYRDVPTFEAANRGNAYRVYLEMEAAAFE